MEMETFTKEVTEPHSISNNVNRRGGNDSLGIVKESEMISNSKESDSKKSYSTESKKSNSTESNSTESNNTESDVKSRSEKNDIV